MGENKIMNSLIAEYIYWLNEINDIDFDDSEDDIFRNWYFYKKRECEKYSIAY
jgi:hypothetical protein